MKSPPEASTLAEELASLEDNSGRPRINTLAPDAALVEVTETPTPGDKARGQPGVETVEPDAIIVSNLGSNRERARNLSMPCR